MDAFDGYRKGQINLKLATIDHAPLPDESHIWRKSVSECQTVTDPASKLYDKLPRDAKKKIDEISTPVALCVATLLFVKGSIDIELTIFNSIKNATRQYNAGFSANQNTNSVGTNDTQSNGGRGNNAANAFVDSFSSV